MTQNGSDRSWLHLKLPNKLCLSERIGEIHASAKSHGRIYVWLEHWMQAHLSMKTLWYVSFGSNRRVQWLTPVCLTCWVLMFLTDEILTQDHCSVSEKGKNRMHVKESNFWARNTRKQSVAHQRWRVSRGYRVLHRLWVSTRNFTNVCTRNLNFTRIACCQVRV